MIYIKRAFGACAITAVLLAGLSAQTAAADHHTASEPNDHHTASVPLDHHTQDTRTS